MGTLRGLRGALVAAVSLAVAVPTGLSLPSAPALAAEVRPRAACVPTTTTDGDYTVVTFTTVGTCDWTAPAGVTQVEFLLVGGGGGGGNTAGGGGGGGGVVTREGSASLMPVSPGTAYPVVVGAGGAAGTSAAGSAGGNTTFLGFTARGGGGGGGWATGGGTGGSGGGGGGGNQGGGAAGQPVSRVGGLGSAGGLGSTTAGGAQGRGAGGGGAGSAGAAGAAGSAGGSGYTSGITGLCYAGGGGGGVGNAITGPGTATCGGGAGGKSNTGAGSAGSAGTANTGGGGGGGGSIDGAGASGGAGGSGIAVIRYLTTPAPCSTTSTSGIYTTVTITRTCSWTAPSGVNSVELLMIGGGGGGGHTAGGGGGAGGVIAREGTATPVTVIPGSTYQAVVGLGGAPGSPDAGTAATNGGNTTMFGLTANGGGRGGNWATAGAAGGSGGGGGGGGAGGAATQPAAGGRGYAGGLSSAGSGGSNGRGGGGGGGGGVGSSATAASGGGVGYTSQITGVCYAGGGGGGVGNTIASAGTASCGGGAGSVGIGSPASNGKANSGGGGGGGGSINGDGSIGGYGGSGIIVLRYPPRPCFTATTTGFVTTVVATSDCSWTAPDDVGQVQVLLVGGGGGGGNTAGGGGGAGGVVARETPAQAVSVTPGTTYPIVIGGGGLGGASGGDTSFVGLTAQGGGAGGDWGQGGRSGGSGGGGAGHGPYPTGGGAATQPASASGGLGSSGGAAGYNSGGRDGKGAGGGGAGGAGAAPTGSAGGTGGAGYTSLLTGQCYGGGGGGGVGNTITSAGSASCGGGAGGKGTTAVGADGAANTGGGGGGGGSMDGAGASGGTGGSGIVVFRYGPRECVPARTTYDGAHTVQTFTSVGGCLWTVPDGVTSVEYLLVGGGGGGGGDNGGGGGAGGFVEGSGAVAPGSQKYLIVGAGGAGGTGGTRGARGTASSFLDDSAAGGGGGGAATAGLGAGLSGGSGGGGGGERTAGNSGGAGNTPEISPAQGNAGGNGLDSGGGGGGAGEAGTNGGTGGGSRGGAGRASTITGASVVYGGGGGGGSISTSFGGGAGGSGGGGNGGGISINGVRGTNGLGGGGGGAGNAGTGGAGGSGTVIVRFTRPCAAAVNTVGQYTIHTITQVGTCQWTAPSNATRVEYLVVAGGGGGAGRDVAGGGGGGGARTNVGSPLTVTPGQAYAVRVGDGGAGSTDASSANGANGEPSWAFGVEAAGGGGGGFYNQRGSSGGSGGGSGVNFTTSGGLGNTPATTPVQGFSGGVGGGNRGAGGGGAGAAGASGSAGANGGAGITSTISGTSRTYGGGGGGSGYRDTTNASVASGAGGAGGGGAGGGQGQQGNPGTDGLGGGGGAARVLGGVGGDGGSGVVIIRHQTATALEITTDPVGGAAGGVLSTQPVLKLVDASGNIVVDDSVTVVTATVNNNGILTNATATANNGVVSFTNLTLGNRTGVDYTLTFTANTPIPLTATAPTTQVTHAAASKVVFTTRPPASTVAGVPFSPQPVVTIQDQYGNTVTTGSSATAAVTLSIQSGGGALAGSTTVNAISGVATFTGIYDDTAATGKVMKAAAAGLADDTAVYAITPAAVSSVTSTVTANPTSIQAGGATRSAITVDLRDAFGNSVGTGGASVTVTSTAGTVGTVIDQGNGTYTTTLTAPATTGTAIVRASVAGAQLDDSAAVALTPGAPQGIAIVSGNWQDDTVATAVTGPIKVKVTDANGNGVPGTSVTFAPRAGSGSVTGGVVTTDDSGIATLPGGSWTVGTAAGTQSMTASLTGTSTSTVISAVATAGVVTKFAVTRAGGSAPLSDDSLVAGTSLATRVTAQDSYGNVNADWAGTVTLTSTAFVGSVTATITSGGFVDDSILPTIAGSGLTITASATGVAASTAASGFVVIPGPLAAFSMTRTSNDDSLGTVVAGSSLPVRVTARDAYGNVVSTWTGSVALTSGGFSGTTSAVISTGGSVDVVLSPTIAGSSTLKAVGGGVSSTSATSGGTLTVTPGPAAALRVSAQPVARANGQTMLPQPVIEIVDGYGNLTASDDTVSVAAGGAGAVGGNTQARASAGVATFSGLTFSGVVGADDTLVFSAPGRGSVVSQVVRSTGAGSATSLRLQVAPPSSSASGAIFSTAPQVAVTDAGGNVATTDDTTLITATISKASGSLGADDTLVGTVTQRVTNGVARFTNLGISGTSGASYLITFQSGGLASASSSVTVTVGAAARLALVAQPDDTIAYGVNVTDDTGSPLQVRVVDSGGNLVTNAGVTLVAARDGDPAAYLKASTASVSSGVATFADLALFGPTLTTYRLTFSAVGIASVTTSPFILSKGTQDIAFAQPTDDTLGNPDRQLTATASSGLPVRFRLPTGTSDDTCSVTNGGLVRLKGVGTCTIEAFQSGDDTYLAAAPVQRTFAISPGLPGAPYITSVSGSDQAVTVRYAAPSDTGGTAITNYRVSARDDTGNVVAANDMCGVGQLSCTLTGLTNGQNYTVRVAAENSVGVGPLSGPRAAAPNSNALAVGNLTATVVDDTTVRLSWTKPALPSDDTFTTYDVYHRVSGTSTYLLLGTLASIDDTSWDDTNLVTGTTYDFKVVTTVSTVSTTLTGYAEITQTPAGVPSAPTNLTAIYSGDNDVTLSWSRPTDDGGAALDDTYTVRRIGPNVDDTQVCGTQVNRSCTLSTTPGATYTFQVRASNRIGLGAPASVAYAAPSSNATLSHLVLANGATPIRDDTASSWTVGVGYATQSLTVTPTADDSAASITVNGASVASGSGVTVGLLPGGATTIKVVVVPPNGVRSLTQTYTITVTRAGPPTQLTVAPTSVTNFASGAALGSLAVSVRDDSNVLATDATPSVTVRASGGSLSGTTTVTAVSGTATFADLTFAGRVGTAYTLTFTSPGLTPATVTVTPTAPGPATALAYTTYPPLTAVAGVTWPSFALEVQDSAGNRVTSDSSTKVSLSLPHVTLQGDTEVTVANGVATFANVSIGTISSGITGMLTVSSTPTLTPPGPQAITYSPGAAASLEVSRAGSGALTSGDDTVITATLRDSAGNIATGATGSVTFSVAGASGDDTGTVVGLGAVPIVNGVSSITISGSQTGPVALRATYNALTTSIPTFSVVPGPAAELILTASAADLPAGSTRMVSARLVDDVGNTVPSSATVTLAQSGAGSVSGLDPITLVGGAGDDTFTALTLGAVTLIGTVTASATLTSNPVAFTVVTGVPASLQLADGAGTLTSGDDTTLTATLLDGNGNIVTEPSYNVTFTSTPLDDSVTSQGQTLPQVIRSVDGVATLPLTARFTGTVSIKATVSSPALTSNSQVLTIVSGPAAVVSLTAPNATSNLPAASTRTFTATLTDAAGNAVTSDDTVTFTKVSGSGSVLGLGQQCGSPPLDRPCQEVRSTAGVATVALTGDQVGEIALEATVTSGGSTYTSQTVVFDVVTGEVAQLDLTQSTSGPLASGTTRNFSATLRDARGNVVTAPPARVYFSKVSESGTGTVVGDDSAVTASGVATVTLTGVRAGQLTLRAQTTIGLAPFTDDTIVTVISGAAAQLDITRQPNGMGDGTPLTTQPIVRVQDAAGNDDSVAGIEVTARLITGSGVPIDDDTALADDTALTDASGVATFTSLAVNADPGTYRLVFSAAGLADDTSASFSLARFGQTITTGPVASRVYGQQPFALDDTVAVSSSGLPVTYDSSTASVCTVAKSSTWIVSILSAGTCTLVASQPGNARYAAATPQSISFTVAKADQAALRITTDDSTTFGIPLVLGAAGGSGTGRTSISVSPASDCTVTRSGDDSLLTVERAGSAVCTITASRAGDGNYNAAIPVTKQVGATKAMQTIAFTSAKPLLPVPDGTYTPSAVATSASTGNPSGLPVSITASGSCTMSGGVVTFTASGACTISADQSGDGNYLAATQVNQVIDVGLLNQTVTFEQPGNVPFGSPGVSLVASSSAGLAVTFTRSAASAAVCSVDDSTGLATIQGVGDCSITAMAAGDGRYAAASPVTRTFTVTASPPTQPYITSTEAGDRSITVGFTAPGFTGGTPVTAYQVTAIPADGGPSVTTSACPADAVPLACTITGLDNDRDYRVTVIAITGAGPGPATDPTPVEPLDPGPAPFAVRELVAVRDDTQVTLYWDPVTPSQMVDDTFDSYVVQYRSTNEPWQNGPTRYSQDDSTLTLTLDDPTKQWEIRVVTITALHPTQAPNNTAMALELPPVAPGKPQDVRMTALAPGDRALITWSPPSSDGGTPVHSYRVSLNPPAGDGDCLMSPVTLPLQCLMTGLTRGGAYNVTVVAINKVGDSAGGGTQHTQPTEPAQPRSVSAESTTVSETAGFEVTWQEPTSDGGATITSYVATATLRTSTQSAMARVAVDDTIFTCSSDGTSCFMPASGSIYDYSFTVTAGNLAGVSPESEPYAPVKPNPEPQPGRVPSRPLEVAAVAGDASAVVSWKKPASEGTYPITDYRVTASPGGQTCLVKAPRLTCTVSDLVNGSPYTFTVAALNGAGWGPESEPSDAVTPRDFAVRPGRPLSLTAVAVGGGSVRLRWRPPASDGGAAITGYRVAYRKVGTHRYVTVPTRGLTLTAMATGLKPGVRYFFRVRAVNEVGPGKGALVEARAR